MKFTFDKSRIPQDKLNDPRLLREEKQLQLDMSEQYLLEVCAHEAIHAIYMERASHITPVLSGPTAFFENGSFSFSNAYVRPHIEIGHVRDNLDMARWYAAGGVADRLLTGREAGDCEDFLAFKWEMTEVGATEDEIAALWNQAKLDVELELRNPEFLRELWGRAWEFKKQLEVQAQSGSIQESRS